jgi:predicted nucleic acid-binding protein
MKKIILDTNAYTLLLKGSSEVLDGIVQAEVVYMSIFVLAELYTGFKGGHKEKENRTILHNFLQKSSVKILCATQETAEIFALIMTQLKKIGQPIPINDIWIAAHALETGSVLMSADNHFKAIAGLRLCFLAPQSKS